LESRFATGLQPTARPRLVAIKLDVLLGLGC